MTTLTATYASPLGPIVIESDGQAITSLRFSNEQACDTSTAQEKAQNEAVTTIPIIAEAIQWLDDYFAGKRPCNVPLLNPQGTAFQKRVWQALLTIPYGETLSYGEIAQMVECRSAQAVGQAVGRNPIALIILKKKLLELEGNPTKTSVMLTRW